MTTKPDATTRGEAPTVQRLAILVTLALLSFAGNSLLCRMALRDTAIDPAGFTVVRLMSGAAVLWWLVARTGARPFAAGSWPMAGALFAYAAAFSFAYVSLPTGTGALLLFGSVQVSMLGVALWRGERPGALHGLGLALAMAGLVILLAPGLHAPAPLGAMMMIIAGTAWGLYSLWGRHQARALEATAGNFLRSVPLALGLGLAFLPSLSFDARGLALAVVSGAITSGLGYALWYTALPHLSASRAGGLQLSVPLLAALLGIVVLAEPLDLRFVLAAAAILGGIGLTLWRRPTRPGHPR